MQSRQGGQRLQRRHLGLACSPARPQTPERSPSGTRGACPCCHGEAHRQLRWMKAHQMQQA
eukprot:6208572-Amphidinium_carterae.1